MKFSQKLTLLFIFITCTTTSLASQSMAAPLADEKATYSVTLNDMAIGTITHTLRSQNGQYLFELAASSDLPLPMELGGTEQSEGIWHQNYPQPMHYSHDYNYGHKNKQQSLVFQWTTGEVINERSQQRFALAPQTHDKLSYQLALRQDLRAHAKKFLYPVTDGKHLKYYHFIAERQHEWLETPMGRIETIRLENVGDKGTTRLWAAPEFNYLWIKIEHEQNNGLVLVAALNSLEPTETAKKTPAPEPAQEKVAPKEKPGSKKQ